ncbi:MAG: M56 family metallopeptidase [Blautia sp.]|uniref:M56 family metallopeptidase n=1 Tax=Blautia sp. TaxID=1955243 RepID=UPI002A81970B|nr:M56 family metallopeptidase [Blautia sp.]MDY4114929.1 M56 family metallopeptidase [Blautia sp.]
MAEFALHILKLNIISAVVIFLVLGLSVLLKNRFTARWKYVVWLAVAMSLLVPARLPSNFSLINFKVPGTESSGNEKITAKRIISADADSANVNSSKVNSEDSSTADSKMQDTAVTGKAFTGAVLKDEVQSDSASASLSGRHIVPLAAKIFMIVWLAGAVIKLLAEICAYCFSMRSLKRMSLPVNDLMKWKMYRDVCEQKGIRRRPELMQNAGLSTPLLAGLFRTKLYLPAVSYSAEELKLVYHHELTHYLHRDLWYKMLLRICASVYWFNPALLFMLWEADKDIENLCDAEVVRVCSRAERKLYRKLLLRTVAIDDQVPYVTASLNDSSMVFKDRILYMLNMKKLRKNVLPGVILAMVLVGGNLAFGFSGETISGAQNTQQQAQKDGDSSGQDSGEDAKKRELVDMVASHGTSDEQQLAGKGDKLENSNSDGLAENSGQGDVADQEGNQDQTGVNSSDETGENSDGQNPDPDNSGGGYSDTDNNGTPGDDTTNKTVINTSSLTLRGSGGSTFEIERVLYSDYSVEYRGYDGVGYTDNGNESYTDDYGNTYPALNDSTHYLGTTLEQHTLTSSDGNTVTVTQTTNGDYYYRDDNGTGFSDNGDGTWTDENGNTYTE